MLDDDTDLAVVFSCGDYTLYITQHESFNVRRN